MNKLNNALDTLLGYCAWNEVEDFACNPIRNHIWHAIRVLLDYRAATSPEMRELRDGCAELANNCERHIDDAEWFRRHPEAQSRPYHLDDGRVVEITPP